MVVGGGGFVRSIISYTTSIVTLDESPGCIYFGVCVSDMDAVCHISELRPEALQLNCCGCVHNLDENPVYIAKEVYFVSPLPSVLLGEICPAAAPDPRPRTSQNAPSAAESDVRTFGTTF